MYSEFFRLTELPFSLTPDPRYLFMSDRHREGLAHLFYGIQQPGGFVQLTGEVGSGKTTLSRCLVRQLPPETDIALILNPRLTAFELLASVCDELGVPYPADTKSIKALIDALNQRLLEAHAQGRRTVLVIDEAQNLHADVLEQVRLLTNLETSQQKLLQIILLGQPELLSMLKRKKLRQLAQRITARYHLLPLSRQESYAYVQHRLLVAGRSEPLFTPGALREVYRLSGGIPRLINIICDRALLGAYALDKTVVTASIIRRASRETQGVTSSRRWLRRTWTSAATAAASVIVAAAILLATGSFSELRRSVGAVSAMVGAPDGPSGQGTVETIRETKAAALPGAGTLAKTRQEETELLEAPKADPIVSGTAKPVQKVRLADVLGNASLRGTNAASFRALASRLGIPPDRSNLGCKMGSEEGFECLFRVGNWTKLRQFDIPALLELTLPGGQRHRAALLELSAGTAALSIGGREYTFPLHEIDSVWDGSFILVWKFPFPARQISLGSRGKDVVWLRQALDVLEGTSSRPDLSDLYDESLRKRVIAFQRERSLPQDGAVGNTTIVRLTLALMGPGAPSLTRQAS
jgi:general secretion pathway protein A